MPAHRYHTPEETSQILRDDCEECARQAGAPWKYLDRDRLDTLTRAALRWEYGAGRVPGDRYPETANERKACQALLDAIQTTAQILGVRCYPEWAERQLTAWWVIRGNG